MIDRRFIRRGESANLFLGALFHWTYGSGPRLVGEDLSGNWDEMAFGVHALQVVDVEVELGLFKGSWLVRAVEKLIMRKSPAGFFVLAELALASLVTR